MSSAVQYVQGGRITGSFHVKGLVVTDLNELLDTHCVTVGVAGGEDSFGDRVVDIFFFLQI